MIPNISVRKRRKSAAHTRVAHAIQCKQDFDDLTGTVILLHIISSRLKMTED